MPRLRFEQLLEIYRATTFAADGLTGELELPSEAVAKTLVFIDDDDDAREDGGLGVKGNPAKLKIGDKADLILGKPKPALGRLAKDLDGLLEAPDARSAEPASYFLFGSKYANGDANPPAEMANYRRVLKFVDRLKHAAAAFDTARQALVFLNGDDRVTVLVQYKVADLARLDVIAMDRLDGLFTDDVHQDQKLEILGQAVVKIAAGVPSAQQFTHLLRNIDTLQETVRSGYRLFVSNFSYAKVRGELEAAKLEFVGKIHKTIVDIQGQLLGIPIATFVVASQMKRATACSVETIADVAIAGGAWIFFGLLILAIANQWMTLSAVGDEVERQKTKIERDFDIDMFASVFARLATRIIVYRVGFVVVASVALGGAIFATIAFQRLVDGDWGACLSGAVAVATPAKS